jgi:hypothetical protein
MRLTGSGLKRHVRLLWEERPILRG